MPRNSSPVSRREQTERPAAFTQINTYAPVGSTRSSSQAANTAQALSQALGTASGLARDTTISRIHRDVRDGTADAEVGRTDEARYARSEDYRRAQRRVRVRAEWSAVRPVLDDEVGGIDWESEIGAPLSMESLPQAAAFLNAYLDSSYDLIFGERYEDEVPYLAEEFGKYRERQLQQLSELAASKERDDNLADLEAAFIASINDEEAGPDWETLYEGVGSLFPNDEKAEAFLTVLIGTAIAEGRPDLLDDAPERLPNGRPSPVASPKNRQRVLAARQQAENARRAREAAEGSAAAAEREQYVAGLNTQIVGGILVGENVQEQLLELATLDPDKARTLAAFASSYDSSADDRRGDQNVESMLLARAYDDLTMDDLTMLADAGVLGDGRPRRESMQRLAAIIQSRDSREQSAGNSLSGEVTASIRRRYSPALDGLGINFDRSLQQIQIAALEAAEEMLRQGIDPIEVQERVRAKYDEPFDRAREGWHDGGDVTSPAWVARQALEGRVGSSFLRMNVEPRQITALLDAGEMTIDEAERLLAMYGISSTTEGE